MEKTKIETKRSKRLPSWFRDLGSKRKATSSLNNQLKETRKLQDIPASICEEAKCPNRSECFAKGVLTFMILGTTCTRNCGFCSVAHGTPLPPDKNEASKIVASIEALNLKFVVLTSPNRDDLPDGGAAHYAYIIQAIHDNFPKVKVEVLIPDFQGRINDLKTVLDAKPDVLNHNLETVPSLYTTVRRGSLYQRSLDVLRNSKIIAPDILTKTGIMMGLGEEREELIEIFKDINKLDVDILTMGQYLKPDKESLEVVRYYSPEEFDTLKSLAESENIRYVFSGPLVRSSYLADSVFEDIESKDLKSCLKKSLG
jgi:lipoyl synthase